MKNIGYKKIFNITTNVVIWMVVVVLLVISSTFILSKFENPYGIKIFSVTSGSMEPKIGLGSLVVIRSSNQYYENDVITFSKNRNINNTTTHRIVQVFDDQDLGTRKYITKGDANEDNDKGEIRNENVLGAVIFSIPYLGYLTEFAKTQLGFILLIIIPATIIIMHELASIKKEIVKVFNNRKSNNDESYEAKSINETDK